MTRGNTKNRNDNRKAKKRSQGASSASDPPPASAAPPAGVDQSPAPHASPSAPSVGTGIGEQTFAEVSLPQGSSSSDPLPPFAPSVDQSPPPHASLPAPPTWAEVSRAAPKKPPAPAAPKIFADELRAQLFQVVGSRGASFQAQASTAVGGSGRANVNPMPPPPAPTASSSAIQRKSTASAASTEPKSDSELASEFVEFLTTFTCQGERGALYKAQVMGMYYRGCYTLAVDFDHLISALVGDTKKKYLDLVVRIGNSESNSWLNPYVYNFLVEELSSDSNAKEELLLCAKNPSHAFITFDKKPSRVEKFDQALRSKRHPLIKLIVVLDRAAVLVAIVRGRVIFHAALTALLHILRLEQWFDSDLALEDFLLFDDEKCIIIKEPTRLSELDTTSKSAEGSHNRMYLRRQSNLKSFWLIMKEHFILAEKLPLHFDTVRDELEQASLSDVKEDWFFDYLENLFALKPSIARRDFITHISKLSKMFNLSENDFLRSVLMGATLMPWREDICDKADFILCGVYWHGVDFLGELAKIAEAVKAHNYSIIDVDFYTMARRDTVLTLNDYKRNLMEHLDNHFEKEKKEKRSKGNGKGQKKSSSNDIDDFDEVEIYTSSTLPQNEHKVLKCVMKHRRHLKRFHSTLSIYINAAPNQMDIPAG